MKHEHTCLQIHTGAYWQRSLPNPGSLHSHYSLQWSTYFWFTVSHLCCLCEGSKYGNCAGGGIQTCCEKHNWSQIYVPDLSLVINVKTEIKISNHSDVVQRVRIRNSCVSLQLLVIKHYILTMKSTFQPLLQLFNGLCCCLNTNHCFSALTKLLLFPNLCQSNVRSEIYFIFLQLWFEKVLKAQTNDGVLLKGESDQKTCTAPEGNYKRFILSFNLKDSLLWHVGEQQTLIIHQMWLIFFDFNGAAAFGTVALKKPFPLSLSNQVHWSDPCLMSHSANSCFSSRWEKPTV